MKLSVLTQRAQVEEQGIWRTYSGDFEVKIASTWSRKYRDLRDRKFRENLEQVRLKGESALTEEMLQEVFAHTVIVDWKGLVEEDGKKIPCTPENVLRVFQVDPRFWLWANAIADNMALYEAAAREAGTKN